LWLHSNFVTKDYITETNYHLTLQDAVNIQYNSGTQRLLKNGKNQKASRKDINEYMDPNNFIKDPKQKFQFLVLSAPSGTSKSTLNNHLKGKGTLNNLGDAFYNAARKYEVNDLYLIAHAQLETGHGTSKLAQGIEVGENKNGNLKVVTSKNRKNLKNIKMTYNMFGIGAVDSAPNEGGAKLAYEEGWYTPKDAVDGGTEWISKNYIKNQEKQETIDKRKWNPQMVNGANWKQYATD